MGTRCSSFGGLWGRGERGAAAGRGRAVECGGDRRWEARAGDHSAAVAPTCATRLDETDHEPQACLDESPSSSRSHPRTFMSLHRHHMLLAVSAAVVLCSPLLDAQPTLPPSSFTRVHAGESIASMPVGPVLEVPHASRVSTRRRVVIGAVAGASVGLLASLMLPVASCAHVETPDCPSASSTQARITLGWTASGAAVGALVGALTTRRSARDDVSPVRLDVERDFATPAR